ncbi:hypothetical protein J7E38_12435 [Bacillus sp. ISL-35]|uniref:hypothetical protein n=1 Tax=Bacillus sp. ISL-35 TaxID=2819122 RepID=UPI001BEC8465|nr:hypothetical protein [Bacillus sp. ISL-35]MBT2679813.1 hypothetical protein [Bacillus sp. ISL-35]MBT2704847.1 hypothetical protein [Chryseobacterium sp. ISL-80]
MKKLRKGIFVSLLFISISIPTLAIATENNKSYSDEKSFLSFFDNLFSALFGEKSYANYDEDEYESFNYDKYTGDKDWYYIGDKKINKKDWEKHFKKKHLPKGEIESKDIWKKWYCYDDDWDDDNWEEWDKKWWNRWH